MSDKTKAVNLTEDEIAQLITNHGQKLYNITEVDARTERINYLNRRLKTFKEPETETDKQDAKANAVTQGWGKENG